MKPELKLLNRFLLCASLLMPCTALKAQEPEKAAPSPEKQEKVEKEERKEKEYKVEKRFEAKTPERADDGGAPVTKLKDKVFFKREPRPEVKVPFLGVVLGPVDESLGAQLGLPEGVGILVRAVMDGSPAARAGVMQHDVLHYFNDQLLVNEPQVQTLVQQAGIGAEVRLTLFRKGRTETVVVKLGETLAQERPGFEKEKMLHLFRGSGPGHGPMEHPDDVRWSITAPYPENYDRELREFQERLQKLHGRPEDMRREIERFTERMKDVAKSDAAKKQRDVLFFRGKDDSDPKVRVQILTDGKDGKDAVATSISSATGKDGATIITHNNVTITKWKNEQGSGELKVENGSKYLTIKDAEGKETFAGSVDSPEQRKKLPPEAREQLERIEQNLKLEIRPLETPEPSPKQPEDS